MLPPRKQAPGPDFEPLTLELGNRTPRREGLGSGRPGVELCYGEGLGFRNGRRIHLRLFPAFLSLDFWPREDGDPEVALLKQSVLAVYRAATAPGQTEVPETHLDQTLGDPQGNCTRLKKWEVNSRPSDLLCPRRPALSWPKGLQRTPGLVWALV